MNKYITTAIPYVNGRPHIGHAMDYLLADTCARYMQLCGDTVKFQAGTDEHGNKILAKATALGIPVEDYVAENAATFRDFIARLGAQPTDFIRTTDPDHERRVQQIWQKLAPHIYPADYEGWYCEGCEGFITEKEYEENHGVCPDHQKPYTRLTETNYYFRIADFKSQIAAAITSGEMRILPDVRAKQILKLLEDTPDVSISRPRKNLSWGIPVPGDDTQVMYVWLDALSNYLTILGYPDQDISAWWPATAQFVGKDILRFHAIIWPAMLLGLGLPLPRTLVSHGFIQANGQKMSKSIGNVVDPLEVIDQYGLPAFRYYFLRHIDSFEDSDFTWEKYDAAYNNELANDLGNLVQRLSTLAVKNEIVLPAEIRTAAPTLDTEYRALMDKFEFSNAFNYVWDQITAINKKIDDTKPWSLAKEGKRAELEQVMTGLIADLLHAAHLLTPFLPDTATAIQAVFAGDQITVPAAPLFPKA